MELLTPQVCMLPPLSLHTVHVLYYHTSTCRAGAVHTQLRQSYFKFKQLLSKEKLALHLPTLRYKYKCMHDGNVIKESSLTLSSMQGETYTLAKAQHAYKSLVKIHEKSGKYMCALSLGSL